MEREDQLRLATKALHEIATAKRDEGGCYYTNRYNISVAAKTFTAITGLHPFAVAAALHAEGSEVIDQDGFNDSRDSDPLAALSPQREDTGEGQIGHLRIIDEAGDITPEQIAAILPKPSPAPSEGMDRPCPMCGK